MTAAWPGDQPFPVNPVRPMPVPPPPPPPPADVVTVDAYPCGHIAGDLCDEECAYWAGVARGWWPGPEAYLTAAGRAAA